MCRGSMEHLGVDDQSNDDHHAEGNPCNGGKFSVFLAQMFGGLVNDQLWKHINNPLFLFRKLRVLKIS